MRLCVVVDVVVIVVVVVVVVVVLELYSMREVQQFSKHVMMTILVEACSDVQSNFQNNKREF
jgi:hypothetical protein